MSQLQSPGTDLRETTLQSGIVRSGTGRAALVGKFNWGPALQVAQVTDEPNLIRRFGRPDNQTADSVMSAINFFSYGNDLRLVRVLNDETAKNASALYETLQYNIASGGSGYEVGDTVTISRNGVEVTTNGEVTEVNQDGAVQAIFVFTGDIIELAKAEGEYPELTEDWTVSVSSNIGTGVSITDVAINTNSDLLFINDDTAVDALEGNFNQKSTSIGIPSIAARYAGTLANDFIVEIASYAAWQEDDGVVELTEYPSGRTRTVNFSGAFQFGPASEDQYAVIVRSGEEVLDSFIVSDSESGRDVFGNNIYLGDFLQNGGSQWINGTSFNWPAGFTGALVLKGGVSGNDTSAGNWQEGWDMFSDTENVYINQLIGGSCAGESVAVASTVQKHVASIVDQRRDSVAAISPPRQLVVNLPLSVAIDNLVEWRRGLDGSGVAVEDNFNYDTTYAFIDGNYKYQYDKYNDVSRWIPLAADIVGLMSYTDAVAAPWESIAGANRGRIRNARKLAIEPRKTHRNRLYPLGINPVYTDSDIGAVLWGDKTATRNPTPFDRINVRRLFNMLKKSIGDSSKFKTFEINDEFTRSSFRTEVKQYLQNIKSRGGVTDFRVICDETNNTPDVIDRNEFVATIYIKPPRSINFITLNFVATATGADFDEIIGAPV